MTFQSEIGIEPEGSENTTFSRTETTIKVWLYHNVELLKPVNLTISSNRGRNMSIATEEY